MYQAMYVIFGILSLLSVIEAIYISHKAYRSKGRGKRVFTALHLFTLGVFIATVLAVIPVYYTEFDFGDAYAFVRPFLISVHHAFRVFILDGEFSVIRDAVSGLSTVPHVLFSGYVALLYVIAPVLTFSNVLSLFKNLKGELRLFWHKRRPFYIFSELNERSLALAESVSEEEKEKKPVIVFTDVFEPNKEEEYERLLRVHDINAICLKKDITRLNVKNKKGYVEFFVIGDDEAENIEQTIKLTEENKNINKRSVFIFSSKPSTGYILDSIDKGTRMLSEDIRGKMGNPQTIGELLDYFDKIKFEINDSFYLCRIDSIDLFVQRILKDEHLLEHLVEKSKQEHTISILLVGLGRYGKQFLKVALWLYQIYGLKLEINIIDAKSEEKLKKDLAHEWPEIIQKNPSDEEGDSNYSITFIDEVDCFTSDFDDLFRREKDQTILRRTQLAIVALGDDEKNIEAATTLRGLFAYLIATGKMKESDAPFVYSVVYDDKKAASLSEFNNIHFVGNLESQFSYRVIANQKKIEASALKQHFEWVAKTRQLRKCYEENKNTEFVTAVEEYFARKKEEYCRNNSDAAGWTAKWNDEDYYYKGKNECPDYNSPDPEAFKEMIENYFKIEYYRLSSIAKAVHDQIVDGQFRDYFAAFDKSGKHSDSPVCLCEKCVKKRISEHMRWNAYMRVNGYRVGKKRENLAKLHPDLVPWEKLDTLERFKD